MLTLSSDTILTVQQSVGFENRATNAVVIVKVCVHAYILIVCTCLHSYYINTL